jgi:uncharacterized protein YbaR (Trm112 family)
MRLTERTCPDCQSKFDLIKDKYFVKKPSPFVTTINVILRCIIVTGDVSIGESKLICETCNRDNKIRRLLK